MDRPEAERIIAALLYRSMEGAKRLADEIFASIIKDPDFKRQYTPIEVSIGCAIAAAYVAKYTVENKAILVKRFPELGIPLEQLVVSSFWSMVRMVNDYITEKENDLRGAVPDR